MPYSDILLAALLVFGAVGITAIASRSSLSAEFSAGKDGIRFRVVNDSKASEQPKIDQAKSKDDGPLPPSLEL
jgi:hypothetical protein